MDSTRTRAQRSRCSEVTRRRTLALSCALGVLAVVLCAWAIVGPERAGGELVGPELVASSARGWAPADLPAPATAFPGVAPVSPAPVPLADDPQVRAAGSRHALFEAGPDDTWTSIVVHMVHPLYGGRGVEHVSFEVLEGPQVEFEFDAGRRWKVLVPQQTRMTVRMHAPGYKPLRKTFDTRRRNGPSPSGIVYRVLMEPLVDQWIQLVDQGGRGVRHERVRLVWKDGRKEVVVVGKWCVAQLPRPWQELAQAYPIGRLISGERRFRHAPLAMQTPFMRAVESGRSEGFTGGRLVRLTAERVAGGG